MLRRFDRYWEVLLGHLMMFRFAYPCERDAVPDWVMAELLSRALDTVQGRQLGRAALPRQPHVAGELRASTSITGATATGGRGTSESESRGRARGAGSELESAAGGGR